MAAQPLTIKLSDDSITTYPSAREAQRACLGTNKIWNRSEIIHQLQIAGYTVVYA